MLKLVVDHQVSSGNIRPHDPGIVTYLRLPPLCESLSLSLGYMWRDEHCRLSHTKGGYSWDQGTHRKMFRPSSGSSSPFSFMDLDMWDAKSRFSAQVRIKNLLSDWRGWQTSRCLKVMCVCLCKASAWCGMAAVSGSEFLSRINTRLRGIYTVFKQHIHNNVYFQVRVVTNFWMKFCMCIPACLTAQVVSGTLNQAWGRGSHCPIWLLRIPCDPFLHLLRLN